jgi:hypothetical protein
MCSSRRPSNTLDRERAFKGSTMVPFIRLALVEDESITALDVARRLGRLRY